jgi:hypothetical protein
MPEVPSCPFYVHYPSIIFLKFNSPPTPLFIKERGESTLLSPFSLSKEKGLGDEFFKFKNQLTPDPSLYLKRGEKALYYPPSL